MIDTRDVLFLAVGGLLIAAGVGVRIGRLRGFENLYRTPGIPVIFRNAAFTLIPVGLFPIGAVILKNTVWSDDLQDLRTLLIGLLLLVPFLVLLLAYRPPRVLVPRWLQEMETTGASRPPGLDRFDVFTLGAIVIGAAIAVGFLGFLMLGNQ